ncbi:unnamed protein product [Moneuplotes crassus]|uniref:Uncharacterized protein n=1 Tax=Euplotes crassus TaxID=5936 RepID=A0AAD1XWW3_EUPCR|nr:unnamed protein product [Moneuplotes crassus]
MSRSEENNLEGCRGKYFLRHKNFIHGKRRRRMEVIEPIALEPSLKLSSWGSIFRCFCEIIG